MAGNKSHTSIDVILVIVLLGIMGILGEVGMMLLIWHNAAVASIALVSQIAGVSIGGLSSMLSSTRSQTPPAAPSGTTINAEAQQTVTATVAPAEAAAQP